MIDQHEETTAKSASRELTPGAEFWIKSIAVGTAVTAVTETGRGVWRELSRHPFIILGMGFAAGFLVHKHRKEILAVSLKTENQVKDFLSGSHAHGHEPHP